MFLLGVFLVGFGHNVCCLLCFFYVRTDSPSVTNKSGKKFGGEDPKVCENSSDADGQGPDDNRKSVKSSAKVSLLPKLSESVVQVTRPPCEDENAMFPDAPLSSSPAKESADVKTAGGVVVDSTSDETVSVAACNCDSTDQKPPAPSPETSPKEKQRDFRDEERETDMWRLIDSAKKGFTRESSKLVTLAQLSLMLEKTAHIRLEYEWHPKWPSGGGGVGIVKDVELLTNMLKRLSNLANLEYRDIMQRAVSEKPFSSVQLEKQQHNYKKLLLYL